MRRLAVASRGAPARRALLPAVSPDLHRHHAHRQRDRRRGAGGAAALPWRDRPAHRGAPTLAGTSSGYDAERLGRHGACSLGAEGGGAVTPAAHVVTTRWSFQRLLSASVGQQFLSRKLLLMNFVTFVFVHIASVLDQSADFSLKLALFDFLETELAQSVTGL